LDRSRTGPLVYHCVDDIAAVPGVDAATYARLEEALVAKSDLTFVTSPGLYELWRKAGPHVHYLPNAVDIGHFAKARDLKPTLDLSSATGPVIGYMGALSDFKVDFKLVLDAVRLRPDWTWVFIGDEREGQRSDDVATLRALPNVHFLGHRPYAELPGYMAAFDVGVLPTLVNAYTRSMYPMKYLEYVAAGLRVVSTRLDFTRDPAVRLEIASNATEFVAAIARQVSLGRFTRAESDAIVGENTWSARTTKMLDLVAKRRPEPTFRVDQSLPSIPSVSSQVAEPN
ncbi:MAG: glycosyl transferase family 1, partial [Hyphomicrobiales bacterium]|nr:glycosyl transferase family 1 [Hyphomicrobiales bacterium]